MLFLYYCQATDIVNAILEGYPKSKKELFVSHVFNLVPRPIPSFSVLHAQSWEWAWGRGYYVSIFIFPGCCISPLLFVTCIPIHTLTLQEEVGIETDEDYGVQLPA